MTIATRGGTPTFTTTNGTDPVSVTFGSSPAVGDLISVMIQTLDAAVPSFVLHGATSGTFTTEDSETITANTDGTVVYKDGTSSSVAYDYHVGDATNGFCYFWSIKITAVSGTPVGASAKITYGGTAGGSNRRATVYQTRPAANTIPVRASRLLCTYGTTGGGTGAGNYTAARISGTTPAVSCAAFMCNRAAGTNNTVTVDFDNDTTFETTVGSGGLGSGNGDGRVNNGLSSNNSTFVDGYFDAGATHMPGASIVVKFAATPSANKTLAAVIYAMEAPAIVLGTAVTENETPNHGITTTGPSGVTVTGTAATENDTPVAGTRTGVTIATGAAVTQTATPHAGTTPSVVALPGLWHLKNIAASAYNFTEVRLIASKLNVSDVGQVSFALLEGATTIAESAILALTDTPTEHTVPIVTPISDPTNLFFSISVRRLQDDSLEPYIAGAGVGYTTHVTEHETPAEGSIVNVTPPPPDPNAPFARFTHPGGDYLPPYDADASPAQRRLARHMRNRPQGTNVWILTTQTNDPLYDVTEHQPQPTIDEAFVARGNTEFGPATYRRFLQGGVTHDLNLLEALSLLAAGYTVIAV